MEVSPPSSLQSLLDQPSWHWAFRPVLPCTAWRNSQVTFTPSQILYCLNKNPNSHLSHEGFCWTWLSTEHPKWEWEYDSKTHEQEKKPIKTRAQSVDPFHFVQVVCYFYDFLCDLWILNSLLLVSNTQFHYGGFSNSLAKAALSEILHKQCHYAFFQYIPFVKSEAPLWIRAFPVKECSHFRHIFQWALSIYTHIAATHIL